MNQDCFVGIQSIPDETNQFRLGTVFLRNFYTALDYDKNLIMIGVNAESAGGSEVEILGRVANPYNRGPARGSGLSGWFVGIVLTIIFGVAVFVAVRLRQIHHQHKLREEAEADKKEPLAEADEKDAKIKESLALGINESLDQSDISMESNHYLSVAEPLDDVKLEKKDEKEWMSALSDE